MLLKFRKNKVLRIISALAGRLLTFFPPLSRVCSVCFSSFSPFPVVDSEFFNLHVLVFFFFSFLDLCGFGKREGANPLILLFLEAGPLVLVTYVSFLEAGSNPVT